MSVTIPADLKHENTVARCKECACTFSKVGNAQIHERSTGHGVDISKKALDRRAKLDAFPYHQRTGVE